jgi:hypothetical protein
MQVTIGALLADLQPQQQVRERVYAWDTRGADPAYMQLVVAPPEGSPDRPTAAAGGESTSVRLLTDLAQRLGAHLSAVRADGQLSPGMQPQGADAQPACSQV